MAIFLQWGKGEMGGRAQLARGRVAPEGAAGGGAGGAAMRRRRIYTYRYDWERFQHTNCLIHPDGHARYEMVLDDFVDSGRFLGQEASLECHLGTRQVSVASVSDLYPWIHTNVHSPMNTVKVERLGCEHTTPALPSLRARIQETIPGQ